MRHRLLGAAAGVLGLSLAQSAPADEDFTVHLISGAFSPSVSVQAAEDYVSTLSTGRGHLLLQPMSARDRTVRERLEGLGVRFLRYVPRHTWIVSVPVEIFRDDEASSLIRWAAPLPSDLRLHPKLVSDLGERSTWDTRRDAEASEWGALDVRFHADVEMAEARRQLGELGARVLYALEPLRAFVIEVDRPGLGKLAVTDAVRRIRPALVSPEPLNDEARENTRAEIVQGPPLELTGAGIVAAMWDFGEIDTRHTDFAGRVITAEPSFIGPHATHVAGILGGDGTASEQAGGAPGQWRGMAPAVQLVTFDIQDDNPSALEAIGQHGDAINEFGASVSNNSWGWRVGGQNGLPCDAFGSYVYAEDYDHVVAGLFGAPITIVFAAGNANGGTGDCPDRPWETIGPPKTAKNVLTVGGINSTSDLVWLGSSRGPMGDGRIKPELVAPAHGLDDGGVTTTDYLETPELYVPVTGTSAAAPAASGCVALLHELFRDLHGEIPTPALTKALLINGARDLGTLGPDYIYGFGGIDVARGADHVQNSWFAEGEISGEVMPFERTFEVDPAQDLVQVTLAWTDPPALDGVAIALINDLDLILIDPSGRPYDPWTLDVNDPGAPAVPGVNRVDPVEQVTVENPEPGTWTARVSGADCPECPQAFALAWRGLPDDCEAVTHEVSSTAALQTAVEVAGPCDTILVAPGIYENVSLLLEKPLILRSIDGPEATVFRAPPASRIAKITADARIEGFTFEGGYAVGQDFETGSGGAVFADGASPRIRHCVFRENEATTGGALSCLYGSPRVLDCVFVDNEAVASAGVGMLQTSAYRIERCILADNRALRRAALGLGGPGRVSRNTIVGNVSSHPADRAVIGLSGSAGTLEFQANIVFFNRPPDRDGIGVECLDENVRLSCNDFRSNGVDHVGCDPGIDDFFDDPRFCQPFDVYGYAISDASPCAPANSPPGCGLVGAVDPAGNCVTFTREPEPPAVAPIVGLARPNPAVGTTRLSLALPETARVRLTIYDVAGRRIWALPERRFEAGQHVLEWDGRDRLGDVVSEGLYFYRLTIGGEVASVGRIVWIR